MRSDPPSPLTAKSRLAIFGAGGSAREVAWLAQQCLGEDVDLTFVIDHEMPPDAVRNGIPIMQLLDFADRYPGAPIAVAIGDPVSGDNARRSAPRRD